MGEKLAFKEKMVWFGCSSLVWFCLDFFGLDCKAMAGEVVCQIRIQLVLKWLIYYTKLSSLLSKNLASEDITLPILWVGGA